MALKLKPGVKINGAHFRPEIAVMLQVAEETKPLMDDGFVWVTSANDGKHMVGSRHGSDDAFDLRVKNITAQSSTERNAKARAWCQRIKQGLAERVGEARAKAYDVVFELDHIHLEYDPK